MKALVLSGGGSKGAYQVGALRVLLGKEQNQYDILCGVSVGAINCAHLALYPLGEEQAATKELEDLWLSLTTDQVYKRWCPFGRLHGLWKSSFYSSAPLRDMLRRRLPADRLRQAHRVVRIGAVSLDTGQYRMFGAEDPEQFPLLVAASAAYPSMLEPVRIEGQLYTDGGVRDVTPLGEAINLGADDIDVIMTSARDSKRVPLKDPSAIDVAERVVDIMSEEIIENDLTVASMINQLVACGASQKKHIRLRIIRPDVPLHTSSLKFEHDRIVTMMDVGEADATKVGYGNSGA